jgi:PAS domain S-box-containing protein
MPVTKPPEIAKLGCQTRRALNCALEKIAAAFGLASVILAGIAMVSYRSLTELVETSNQAAHSYRVLEKLEEVLSQIKDAESGQRGYLITGQEIYLDPYYAAIEVVEQEVKDLRRLTANNPNQQRRLDTLEPLIAQRLAVSKQIIDLRKNEGFEIARQVLLAGRGRLLMDNIRQAIREMKNAENVLLKQQAISAEASARNTIITLSSGIFLNFFILAAVYYFIYRESSDRKRAEEALRESQQMLQSVIDNIPQSIFWKDRNSVYLGCNRNFAQLAGVSSPENIVGKTDYDLPWKKEETNFFGKCDRRVMESDTPEYHIVEPLLRADGKQVWLGTNKVPLHDSQGNVVGILGTFADITERKQAEEKIKASLQEKEMLLKEIHHRVKNNLQIISSLLKLQSGYTKDIQTLEMFKESQSRIRSMALIHEKLYQSNDLSRVNFAEYISNLVANLFRSYEMNLSAIKPSIKIENVFLEIDVAVPCGLILNELVSNSLKYAFPNGREGEVRIELYSTNERNFTLIVSDNGVGLPKNLDLQNTKTLGLQLVNNLVEQLEGTVKVNADVGTEFRITFTG